MFSRGRESWHEPVPGVARVASARGLVQEAGFSPWHSASPPTSEGGFVRFVGGVEHHAPGRRGKLNGMEIKPPNQREAVGRWASAGTNKQAHPIGCGQSNDVFLQQRHQA
jgi:hypothetical protein